MFRLQLTSVSGFPRRGSLSACHALRTDPPSSKPASGFPAVGLPENSRLGHSQGVARLERSQIHQSQFLHVFVYAPALWSSKGSLAPSFEMSYQAKFKKAVDGRQATKKGSGSELVMLLGDAGTWNERGRDIEKTEHRVLDGKRIRDEGPANRRRAAVEAFGREH